MFFMCNSEFLCGASSHLFRELIKTMVFGFWQYLFELFDTFILSKILLM